MSPTSATIKPPPVLQADDQASGKTSYRLDNQAGYLLRLANQRHVAIFQRSFGDDLTPTQFTTMLRIAEQEEVSQNHLGRLAAIDIATVKGVVDRLKAKSLIEIRPDPEDKRRSLISLSPHGAAMIDDLKRVGKQITRETLSPLSASERKTFIALLRKLS